jgi:hypothetical protein
MSPTEPFEIQPILSDPTQGNTIVELGGQNFEITDCDVLGTATIFHTG